MLDLVVHGAAGRMGRRVVALAQERADEVRVVAALGRAGDARIGMDAGALAGVALLGVPLSVRLDESLAPGAAIDFSDPEASASFVELCRARRIPAVIATTGFHERVRARIEDAAKDIPVLVAANLSVGVALLTRLVTDAARALGLDADVEIVEAHHRRKKDAPSGTALHLARAVAAARSQDPREAIACGRSGLSGGDRPRGEIGVQAARLGDVVGEHTVSFGFGAERVELSHKAHSRDVFALGALQAARFVSRAKPGLYDAQDMVDAG